ncbi:ROK family protein [Streptococcus moroccensis]|uniref:NBD/HSP70 family sugar kinase n=1 Tax=Streptococcus moroccensis TaxID=1451356 RepID=A0ABT9YQJ4_9STRE|nr:ROK family protein [Streptococcus moroccensis]MDQ0222045.1 putative NBD/HSP70 family sugar kinase [Streptococcus moroccensis]
MITDKYLIREQNESLVLKTIIENQPISRADISTCSHLNKATVSSITTSLMDQELVIESGIGPSGATGGRKPIFLTFNAQAGLAIAIDIGYNYISSMLSYLDGTSIYSQKKRLSISSENLLDEIIESAKSIQRDLPHTPHGIVGMSVAIHGIVVDNNIRFSPFYDVTGTSIHDALTRAFSFPILIENEANLTALGEYTFAFDQKNLISVSIHSGIGVGIIQDNKLQTGAHGHSGEIGHTILYKNGLACACGNRGCLEKYASNKAIYEKYSEHYSVTSVNSDTITKALQEKDSFTEELLDEKIAELAIGINSLVMLYDPEIIIINSSLYNKNPKYIGEIKKQLNSVFARNVTLSASSLDEEATLYGGISAVVTQFLKIPFLKFKA